MAKTVYDTPSVGLRVYRAYKPAHAGIITEVIGRVEIVRPDKTIYVSGFWNVRIKWLNGLETVESTNGLQDFDALIEEHRKKLATHLATLKRLERL